jgi:putative ABC transport system substrate-binding protein
LDVRTREDLQHAFESLSLQNTDAVIVGNDTITQAHNQLIADLTLKRHLPSIYSSREFVAAGGLISFGVSYPDLYRRAAFYVEKIFKGANPGDLPFEQPVKFEL